ncbi:hypothetical protein Lesp02_72810 [Lentzea sp. NBRC 105346]|uniref:hypothetical protein n=1 Tax=Lentzea sp. NBRC 105346 TaxID=3032205 RepID=UPI0024A35E6D|nr:hypothetical protein [Lentzea sp. NBRC 105346]GLZ35094.1 hypothetical protein Lesp02_72810 [Lentzea sp. NBRC 105346]
MNRRLGRAVATITTALAVATGITVVEAPAAQAGNCTGRFCGAVKNRTGRTMYYTTTLGSGSGFCDVWNRDGGTGSNFWHAPCNQLSMGNGVRGGNGTGYDVDAFTFNNWGYHERFTRVGTWHWRSAGVWTKIRDGEIADCGIGDQNEIWCTVLVQAG